MGNLDDKLRKLKLSGKAYVNSDSLGRFWGLDGEAIAQIKQAFTDAGYSDQTHAVMPYTLGYMTGQEWYDAPRVRCSSTELGRPRMDSTKVSQAI